MKKCITDYEIQAEVNRRVQEARQQYKVDHTPIVEMKYGNVYISVKEYDDDSASAMDNIVTLLRLMNVEFSRYQPLSIFYNDSLEHDNSLSFIIQGEDEKLTIYIQEFIDNGYRLKY